MKTAVIISGYFDPIHKGHIELINKAAEYGDEVWVILNSDEQSKLKKGKSFMEQDERRIILSNIRKVNKVFISCDKDKSVNETLSLLYSVFLNEYEFIFANGGDVNRENCREEELCQKLGIVSLYELGDKIQSSSELTGIKSNDN